MRIGIWWLVLVVLAGCKASSPSTSQNNTGSPVTKPRTNVALKDDLSRYRIRFEDLVLVRPEAPETVVQPLRQRQQASGRSSLTVNESLDQKMQQIAQRNLEAKTTNGYRVLLYSGTRRAEAEEVLKLAQQKLATRVRLDYEQPNYRVKVGNYYTRLRAHKAYIAVKDDFPAAFIVPDKIEIDLSNPGQ